MKKEKKATTKIVPLGDRVLIRELSAKDTEKKTSSGIIIPDSVNEDRGAKQGTVVAVGTGRVDDGKKVPVEVKENDIVLFQWGDKVKIEDEEYYLVKESEILAVIK